MKRTFIRDLEECKRLWDLLIKPTNVSDLWDFRMCFHRHFRRKPSFMLLEDSSGIVGMLPLCYVEELEAFFFFPGEVWHKKTWIEQTPFYLRDANQLEVLLSYCPARTFLRYMAIPKTTLFEDIQVDEINYQLHPSTLNFDVSVYRKRFSSKRLKAIMKTVGCFTDKEFCFHINRIEDFNFIAEMSVQQYGYDSYLYDHRFREGFRDIMLFLMERNMLRMVSLEIMGNTAAVDLGALFSGVYTVFLGATNPGFPGVAKVINMHHIEFACDQRVSKLDFLCGDFHWKKLWHLDANPLYQFMTPENWFEEETTQEAPDFINISQELICQG